MRTIHFAAAAAALMLALAPPGALADPPHKHRGEPFHAYHEGGPPPWAPAHGYRAKRGGAAYALPFGLDLGQCNRDLLGAVVGGAAGGLIGSRIGKGSGTTAAIIGGTVLGAIVGGSIGRSMDRLDHACIGQVLEHLPDSTPVAWRNPDTGGTYQVVPAGTFQDRAGRYCREWNGTATIGGKVQPIYGTACRQPNGAWEIVG